MSSTYIDHNVAYLLYMFRTLIRPPIDRSNSTTARNWTGSSLTRADDKYRKCLTIYCACSWRETSYRTIRIQDSTLDLRRIKKSKKQIFMLNTNPSTKVTLFSNTCLFIQLYLDISILVYHSLGRSTPVSSQKVQAHTKATFGEVKTNLL